jgi:hypothetical protein
MADDDITPSDGIPLYDLEYATPDTAKIITNETSTAMRIDNAYMSGFNEGFIHGKLNILPLIKDILMRAGNSEDDSENIIQVIARHAGIIEQYQRFILSHKKDF